MWFSRPEVDRDLAKISAETPPRGWRERLVCHGSRQSDGRGVT